ncbi:TRAP transporter substrate-binding protein DctP [Haloarcula nitratireducens]|uniref:TRAP transporter substrate-binding protein DctP n=1 Tax=Haloarcula nitratireducens TaxID=2487749 RepID=A0AAW4PF92_9EURY|nr:TRAP transporter substrate-binding protein DctP [Halomicroarcula nitratireducens]MBX0297051.1 TRAP transporter substrate-binding protein DctP [Halomicroarcula nitratireducens]
MPEMTVTLGHSGPEDITQHQHRAAMTFKNYIESATNGNFTIEVSPGGALGSLREMIEQNQSGSLELVGSTAEGHLAPFYPNINVYALPYAFRNVEVANYVFDKKFGDTLWKDFREKTGLRMLTWYDNGGFRSFGIAGSKIKSIDDMKGLDIRTMQIEAHQKLVSELGANPTPIDWNELYQAIDQGVVDGQENSIPTVISGDLHEVLDFIILDRHVFTMNFIHANEEWFQSLPPYYRRLVIDAGHLASKDARKINRIQRRRGVQTVEEAGVTVYDPPQDVIEDFRKATQEPVGELVREKMDNPELVDQMQDAIKQAEKDLGYQ